MGKYTPTVYVYPRPYQLMSLWARLGGDKNREMTCFGRAELDSRGDVYITDAYMVSHEADSGGVDADDDDINKLMFELDQKGIPPDEAFRCWVHSHPGRGSSATYLSATDEAMISRFMLGEFLVSIVFDSAGEHPYCRIDFKMPRVSIEADVEIYIPYLSTEDVKWAKDIYEEKARSKPVFISKYKGGSYKTTLAPKKGAATHVIERPGLTGMGLADDTDADADWDYFSTNYGGSDEDPGTEEIIVDETEVPEYEMTLGEYAYFNQQMSGQVDGIAQQVMNGEMAVDDGLEELVKLGYSKSQAIEEMEFRLGSTVEAWEVDDSDVPAGERQVELPEFEPPTDPETKDAGFWSGVVQHAKEANDTRKVKIQ